MQEIIICNIISEKIRWANGDIRIFLSCRIISLAALFIGGMEIENDAIQYWHS